jgi:hypothetical protein
MKELMPWFSARAQGCLDSVWYAAREEGKSVLKITWDQAGGFPAHVWGYVQWTVRPFTQGQGCDGTIDESVHLIGLRLCEQLGLDYAGLNDEAYPEEAPFEFSPEDQREAERETEIPPLSIEALRLLLEDLTEINNHSLRALLEKRLIEIGTLPAPVAT